MIVALVGCHLSLIVLVALALKLILILIRICENVYYRTLQRLRSRSHGAPSGVMATIVDPEAFPQPGEEDNDLSNDDFKESKHPCLGQEDQMSIFSTPSLTMSSSDSDSDAPVSPSVRPIDRAVIVYDNHLSSNAEA